MLAGANLRSGSIFVSLWKLSQVTQMLIFRAWATCGFKEAKACEWNPFRPHEDPQATFFCDQHDFLVATDALFSKGDKRISCCGNLISTLISGQKT